MRLIPKDKHGKIQYCRSHLEQWAEHASEIGVSPERVADLAATTEAAEQALIEQLQAQAVAQAATLKLNMALAAMQKQASDIVAIVRCNARSGGSNVYQLACIPAPANPSPVGSPGTPERFRAQLQQNGALTLDWTCKLPRSSTGTVYEISRRIDQGAFVRVGLSGKKRFVDQTIPPGASSITYRVQAIRSTGNGPVAEFNVNFGTAGQPVALQGSTVQLAA